MSDNQADDQVEIIPEREFREAINACRKDPELDRYYRFASPAARRFIGLGFYSTYFGEKADKQKYADYLARIEPNLSESDLRYLIRFETDKRTRSYLKDLLARPKAPPPPPSKPEEPKRPAPAPKPVAATQARPATSHVQPVAKPVQAVRPKRRKVSRSVLTLLLSSLALSAVVIILLLFFMFRFYQQMSVKEQDIKDLKEEIRYLKSQNEMLINDKSRPVAPVKTKSRRAKTRQELADEIDAARNSELPAVETESGESTEAEAEAEDSSETTDAVKPADKGSTAKVVLKRRLRLTDGTRIVRRPDGTTEVPREFSYAGAGLKKPFWPYDAELERSGKMEREAANERKARADWQALRDEAKEP